MLKYLFKRILWFIPTLVIITLIAFIINVSTPGDPVDRIMNTGSGTLTSVSFTDQVIREEWRNKLGLDLPVFYITLNSLAHPDTLHEIDYESEREALERMLNAYGNWTLISDYWRSLEKLDEYNRSIFPEVDSEADEEVKLAIAQISVECVALRSSWKDERVRARFEKLYTYYDVSPFMKGGREVLDAIIAKYVIMQENSTRWQLFIPALRFYGNNQYHRWLFGDGNMFTGADATYTTGVIRGDFGLSYITKQGISERLGSRIFWSLLLTVLSVALAYIVSIPIGALAAVMHNKWFDRVSGVVLFMLYSLPSFFLAVLLLMIFANSEWFSGDAPLPASGVKPPVGYPDGAGLWTKVRLSVPYLVLPVICYTYSSIAFLSRTMRHSLLEVVNMDFIRTARAKGLDETTVIRKHGIRNAMLPIITLLTNIFPAALGGSVILEKVFTIPGMGSEILNAIYDKDYPVLVAIFTLTGLFTMLGYLLSDVLYVFADPRIAYNKE